MSKAGVLDEHLSKPFCEGSTFHIASDHAVVHPQPQREAGF